MSRNNVSIQTLALQFIQNKDNKNFKLLIERLKPGLLTFAFNFTKDKDSSEEVVSRTFISIWKKIDQYNDKYNFSTWVYAIAKNHALGILRENSRNVSLEKLSKNNSKLFQIYNPIYDMDTECVGANGEQLVQQLYDASISVIKELKEPYRTVMIEREINQKQLNDIADDLSWNLSTVKTRLRKARKDIADILYKKYPDLVDSYYGK